jgi:outer membrane immunogenic protein
MIKAIAATGAGLGLLLASPAFAADPIFADQIAQPVYMSGAKDWSGVFIAGFGGYEWADADLEHANLSFFGQPGAGYSQDGRDSVLGVAIGYDHQFANRFVLGGELAVRSGSDLDDGGAFAQFNNFTSSEVSYVGTAAARFGYAFDRFLPYAKAGYAGAKVRTSQSSPGSRSFSDTDYAHGYVVGAGFEVRVTEIVTLGLEYNYTDLGSISHSGPDSGGQQTEIDSDLSGHGVFARVGLRF